MKVKVGDGGGVKVGVSGATVHVGEGAWVVLTGVFVQLGAGVLLGKFGFCVVGMGVLEGWISVGVIVSASVVGVPLAVGVPVWLGVGLDARLDVVIGVGVRLAEITASHAATPANPVLYASSNAYNRLPRSSSSPVTWLPVGFCTSHP